MLFNGIFRVHFYSILATHHECEIKKILFAYKKQGARIETKARVKLKEKKDFSLWYTPGVGVASLHLWKHPEDAREMSIKKNSVAVISDGSAVLGLGNIGPYGALPVMEGKALIFKEKAGIDAWPLVLDLTPLKLRQASTQEEVDFIVRHRPRYCAGLRRY